MKIFIICPTYRNKNSNNIRYFGIISLIKQIKEQNGNHDIKLAIADSSPDIHDFFKNHDNSKSCDYLYFHINDRNNVDIQIKNNFSYAHSFLPNDNELHSSKW